MRSNQIKNKGFHIYIKKRMNENVKKRISAVERKKCVLNFLNEAEI